MRRTAGIILLLSGWVILFFWLTFMTELVFAPWDTAITQPEIGTWQRTLNDFFATEPGNLSLAVMGVGMSVILTLTALRRGDASLLRLAGMNWLCLVLLIAAFVPVTWLNNWLFPYPPVLYDPDYAGYHRSVLPGGVVLAICAGWLLWQRRAVFRR